ncbi:uncharacterized protein LOC126147342 [Schistocerca cancellata]|uniref:uncharacterized protein LOC126147342 n=1 Tax=Schistocerca cancellata TaxID=274614 RepID=UPI0021178483|nr:uncharacterized protein LOC126147342 [Schistocerca cancellata]
MRHLLLMVSAFAVLATSVSLDTAEESCSGSCPEETLYDCRQNMATRKYYKFSHPCRSWQCGCKTGTHFNSVDLHHCNGLSVDYCPSEEVLLQGNSKNGSESAEARLLHTQ